MSVRPITKHPLSRLLASIGFLSLASGLPAHAEPNNAQNPAPPPAASAPVQVADAAPAAQLIPASAAAATSAAESEEIEQEEGEQEEGEAAAPLEPAPITEAPVAPPRPRNAAEARAAAREQGKAQTSSLQMRNPPGTFDLRPSNSVPNATVTETVLGTLIEPGLALPASMRTETMRPEEITRQQAEYLQQRFDLTGRSHPTMKMSGGRKHVPMGPTARLAPGITWDRLARMSPAEIKRRAAFPFTPLWHPAQDRGGMVFPTVQTRVMAGLDRNDMIHDLPHAYLPEFPAPLYLTSRPDLGDVSQGQLITAQNVDALLRDVLTPTQLEGAKLMLQKTAARHHNMSDERATLHAVAGVACMDCHVNGHTTAQFSLTPDMRPQSERFRMDTSSLRGLYMQSWYGAKRSLRSLEQFIPTEQAAYFDGDGAAVQHGGGRTLTPGEIDAMAQFIRIVDFPPAPKLAAGGVLDKRLASEAELRGERVFQKHCQSCHAGPAMSDNLAHDLRVERFYDHVGSTRVGNPGRAEGAMKTPSLRGLKDSPPYLHDGRLLTLEDAVEFFNIVLQARLDKKDRTDLVEYLRTL